MDHDLHKDSVITIEPYGLILHQLLPNPTLIDKKQNK